MWMPITEENIVPTSAWRFFPWGAGRSSLGELLAVERPSSAEATS